VCYHKVDMYAIYLLVTIWKDRCKGNDRRHVGGLE